MDEKPQLVDLSISIVNTNGIAGSHLRLSQHRQQLTLVALQTGPNADSHLVISIDVHERSAPARLIKTKPTDRRNRLTLGSADSHLAARFERQHSVQDLPRAMIACVHRTLVIMCQHFPNFVPQTLLLHCQRWQLSKGLLTVPRVRCGAWDR